MRQAHRLERLADERDVVRGTATAAGLRDEHGQLVGVVLAGHDRFHDLARDQDGRIADVVVHILQARVHRTVVHGGQQLHVVAEALEDGHEQLEVVRRHLRRQDGIARIAHLLGELGARELRRGTAFALLELGLHLGRGLFREACGRLDGRRRGLHGLGIGAAGLLARRALLGLGQQLLHVQAACAAARGVARLLGRPGLGLLVGLVLQGRKQAAHADARGAEVRHLVDLQHGVHLARLLQDLLHLIGGQRVKAAAEAVQLDEVEVLALRRHLRRGVQARVVHPLVHQADGALERAQVRDGVLGEHRQAEAGQKLGDGVVDLGVVVVRAARQHDAVRVGLLHPQQRLGALLANVCLERLVLGPCDVDRGVDLGLRGRRHVLAAQLGMRLNQLHEQALLQVLLLIVGQPRVQELRVRGAQLVDVEAQRLGVACHDGAVEMVAGALVLLALPLAAGEPDEVGVLVQQVHDVAVRELRRVAHALRRHGLDAGLIGFLRGRVREHHAPAQLREESEPERVVLVHVQRARNAHGAARRILLRQRRVVVEQALGLVLEQVGDLVGLRRLAKRAGALLAAIARDEAAMLARCLVDAEVVDGEQAVVRARLAAHGPVRRRKGLERVKGQQAADLRILAAETVAGKKRRAERAHVAGDVGTHGVHARKLLEGTQHGVVEERATLHDDLAAHVVRVADLDDLEQGVLDDRDGQARGDVANGGAFLLRLLHAAVHEHGAAAAQVDGVFRADGGLRELGHVQVQAAGEALDEAAAARGARLVEHDVVDDAVFHAQALHVLAADIQDELNARQHLLRAAQVRDRLDLARVHAQCLKQQVLAVARDRGVADGHQRVAGGVARQLAVELGDGGFRAAEHVALVRHVMGPQQLAVLADERGLERGGAGVDAQEGGAAVAGKVAAGHALAGMAGVELVQFGLVGEQRRQTHDLAALDVAEVLQALEHV